MLGLYFSPMYRRALALADSGGSTPFDVDAQNYLSACVGVIPDAAKQLVNDFFLKLKADGNFTEIDRMCILGMAGGAANGLLNAAKPLEASAINHGATYIPFKGFKGDGVGTYIDFSYNPAVNSVKFLPNNNSFGFVAIGDSTKHSYLMSTGGSCALYLSNRF